MRFLMQVTLPHEKFNKAIRSGEAAPTINQIISEQKPEAVYFTEICGKRTALLIVDVPSTDRIPSLCEPWMLTFNSDVQFHPVMLPEDLKKAGLERIGQAWK